MTKAIKTPAHFLHLRDKFVTIVALGDSITAVNHWTHGGLNWVNMLWMGLYEVFPQGFTIINSGISGDSMSTGLKRIDRDVLRFDPDIVIISYGMNDCLNTTPEQFRVELIQGIEKIRTESNATILLRTPNPMVNMFNGKELNQFPDGEEKTKKTDLGAFAKIICEVSESKKTLLVDHYSSWKKSMKTTCVGDIMLLMGNPQHPNHLGHRRFYHELCPVFNACSNFFYEWERILRNNDKEYL